MSLGTRRPNVDMTRRAARTKGHEGWTYNLLIQGLLTLVHKSNGRARPLRALARMGSIMDGAMSAAFSRAAAATASSGGTRRAGFVLSSVGPWSMKAASFGLATSRPCEPSERLGPTTLWFIFPLP